MQSNNNMNENTGEAVSVLIPRAIYSGTAGATGCYDYRVPDGMALGRGDIVQVPLGQKKIEAVVWDAPQAVGAVLARLKIAPEKLKTVLHKYDVPPLAPDMCDFIDWVADYSMAPKGNVVRQVLRVRDAFEPEKPQMAWRDGGARPKRMTAAREKIYHVLKDGAVLSAAELARKADVSAGVVKALADAGGLEQAMQAAQGAEDFAMPQMGQSSQSGVAFSPEQKEAAEVLRAAVASKKFAPCLLDGVTGSGKTEVYFEAIAEAMRQGRESLVLLPEISLTSQFLDRFTQRFGCAPALWHSGLSPAKRRRVWRGVAEGKVSVLVGARSALFLPYRNLGVVVVDEEHDAGFKQEEGVIYNARDMAVLRARLAGAAVVLASATPSLESYLNAKQGRYQATHLPHRFGAAQMPDLALVDMRNNPPPKGCWLAPPLVEGLRAALNAGGQGLLYLNRRGYAPLTLCRACGHRYACPDCDSWLVEHRFRRELICHQCGLQRPMPKACDGCGEEDCLVPCGGGVERISEEVAALFPDKSVTALSSDLTGNMTRMAEVLRRITDGQTDIIVGTQIIAKGHHFPKLAFVGVVDADLGLGNGDLRAAERTYQILSQVAGRAGREALAGRAFLQSYMPDHPVLQALLAGDRDAFFERETQMRQHANMPPFSRLAGIIISGANVGRVRPYLHALAKAVPRIDGVQVLGPAPAPIARIRGQYRFRFLVRAAKDKSIQGFISSWLGQVKPPPKVKCAIDIDPYSFL